MMKLKNVKTLFFGLFFMIAFSFMNTTAYAKTMKPDEIQGPAYIIGSHAFTREVNETIGYEGRLTTNLIMLASKTIESSDLDSMIIYYKTATGMWINGLTGNTIEPPTSFNIDYTNLKLETVNSTVSVPKAPILELESGGPLSFNSKTGIMEYQLNIFIDDIDDKNNKISGVEIGFEKDGSWDYEVLGCGEHFSNVSTISDSYTGNDLVIGKQYHWDFTNFEAKYDEDLNISARTYVFDENGTLTYSEYDFCSINLDTAFPQVGIINKYSNPEYIYTDGDFYTYKLGIEQPEGKVFKDNPEKFGYMVLEEWIEDGKTVRARILDIVGLKEEVTITVSKESVRRYSVILGYWNEDNALHNVGKASEKKYLIDTRTLTAPVLSGGYDSEQLNDYLYINDEFYKNQEKSTLDYQIEGIEIYGFDYEQGSDGTEPKYKITYTYSIEGTGPIYLNTKDPSMYYMARVYATNAEGEKIYSDFSDVIEYADWW